MFAIEPIALQAIAQLCRRYHVRSLALFGSALRDELRPESDIDLLVDFEPNARVGMLTLAGLARELASVLGRPVDLVPRAGLKPRICEEILTRTEVLFAA